MSSLRILAFVALALAAASRAAAERPTGNYTIGVSAPEIFVPVATDPNAPEPVACASAQGITLCLDALSHPLLDRPSPSGSFFKGGVLAHVSGALAPAPVAGSLSARLGGPAKKRKATLRIALSGPVQYAGAPVLASVLGKGRCEAGAVPSDPLDCRARPTLCVIEANRTLGCAPLDLALALPQQGGAWQLHLDNLSTNSHGEVSGTARVVLAHGQTFPFALKRKRNGLVVRGRYDAHRDRLEMELVSGLAGRIKLSRVELFHGVARKGTMTFRIAGYKGKVDLAPPEPGAP